MLRYAEPGWIALAVPDGRRGLWLRLSNDALELCAGREGDDDYVKIPIDAKMREGVYHCLEALAGSYGLRRDCTAKVEAIYAALTYTGDEDKG